MEVRDSRRLTGPNILGPRPGAVLDVALETRGGRGSDEAREAVAAWRRQARRILAAVGWGEEETLHRVFAGGVSLAITAPVDALYAATEVNEWAWEAATAVLAGRPEPAVEGAAERLRAVIAAEARPALLALQAATRRHGVTFLSDDDHASVGLGSGSQTWAVDALPAPGDVAWAEVHDVPVALVTGTNGKTTTVRLLAAMARAAGRVPGYSTTDGVWAGEELLDGGDYSGPGGARRVLRDRRVEIALLETARGGMLRRGLGVERAEVAVLTNVAEDHLGEWGIHDLDELAETKLIIRRAAGRLVLNADDPVVRAKGKALVAQGVPVSWFSLDPAALGGLSAHDTCFVEGGLREDGEIVYRRGGDRLQRIARLADVPLTLGGAARHNVANVLGAVAAAFALRLPVDAVRQGLQGFAGSSRENPGRLNLFELGDVRAIVDFAHNPHGMLALMETARALPAKRRLVLLGQAGDRDDEAIRQLTRQVWQARPDRVVIKEMAAHLRGRASGELPRLMTAELLALGAPEEAIGVAEGELAAVRQALEWARPGDLLLLVTHEDRRGVLDLLESLRRQGWRAGQPLPE